MLEQHWIDYSEPEEVGTGPTDTFQEEMAELIVKNKRALVLGRGSTGKSHLIGLVRPEFKALGYKVICIACTHAAVTNVNDVESPSVVVEQLWQISICGSLVLIKFLAIVIIDDVSSLGGINSVTTTAYFRSSLIDESTLRVFLDNWETVFIIFKITTDLMRVEVVLFNVERSWKLTLIVEFLLIKHFVTVEIVDNITSSGIGEVTSLIGWLSIFIQELASLFVLISKDITLFISIEITDNIALIESSGLSIWWYFDKALLTEVLEGIALHHHT